jgi:uncharacterized damage-inducible protein DinB
VPAPSDPRTIVFLFQHNTWANLRLLDACAGLDDAQLDATVPGTMGTLRATLQHICGAEERYLAALTDAPRPPSLERSPWPGIDDLRARAQATGAGLAAVAARREATEGVPVEWQGEKRSVPVGIFLLQAINHATEHRAHVTTILTQQGITPPELDGWNYHEAAE